MSELKEALGDLFRAMKVTKVRVEKDLTMPVLSFIIDFCKMLDEVRGPADLVRIWHVDEKTAKKIYCTVEDVLHGGIEVLSEPEEGVSSDDSEEDVLDEDSDGSADDNGDNLEQDLYNI